jgi:hypothetical protein
MKKIRISLTLAPKGAKILQFLAGTAILLTAMTLAGCKKDNNTGNEFVYDGDIYSINGAAQVYYGHYSNYGAEANNIDLWLASGNYYLIIEMFVPNSSTKLVEGAYQGNTTRQPYTFAHGGVYMIDEANDAAGIIEMKSGVVNVSVSGNNYTIEVDATLTDNSKLTGYYSGTLEYIDSSDENAVNIGDRIIRSAK